MGDSLVYSSAPSFPGQGEALGPLSSPRMSPPPFQRACWLAWGASASMPFRSKERGTRIKDYAKTFQFC